MNPSEGVREIEKENLKRLLHKLCNLMDGENTWEEVDEKVIAILSEALTQAEKRGFERARAEAITVIEKSIKEFRDDTNQGMWGKIGCMQSQEAIRNLTYEKKEAKNAKTN